MNAVQLEEKIKNNGDISDPKLFICHSVKNLEHYITYYQNPDSWTEKMFCHFATFLYWQDDVK